MATPVNSEKTIFMNLNRQDPDFIIHGLCVDVMMHVATCVRPCDESSDFLELFDLQEVEQHSISWRIFKSQAEALKKPF
jgi:hypothetical protein